MKTAKKTEMNLEVGSLLISRSESNFKNQVTKYYVFGAGGGFLNYNWLDQFKNSIVQPKSLLKLDFVPRSGYVFFIYSKVML